MDTRSRAVMCRVHSIRARAAIRASAPASAAPVTRPRGSPRPADRATAARRGDEPRRPRRRGDDVGREARPRTNNGSTRAAAAQTGASSSAPEGQRSSSSPARLPKIRSRSSSGSASSSHHTPTAPSTARAHAPRTAPATAGNAAAEAGEAEQRRGGGQRPRRAAAEQQQRRRDNPGGHQRRAVRGTATAPAAASSQPARGNAATTTATASARRERWDGRSAAARAAAASPSGGARRPPPGEQAGAVVAALERVRGDGPAVVGDVVERLASAAQLVQRSACVRFRLQRAVERRAELRRGGRGASCAAAAAQCHSRAVAAGLTSAPVRTGERLVEHERERADVGPLVDPLTRGLLGRHVGERADDVAGSREQLVAGQVGDPEVDSFAAAPPRAVRHDHVLRLDVAVDDAAAWAWSSASQATGPRAARRGRSAPRSCSSAARVGPTSSEIRYRSPRPRRPRRPRRSRMVQPRGRERLTLWRARTGP